MTRHTRQAGQGSTETIVVIVLIAIALLVLVTLFGRKIAGLFKSAVDATAKGQAAGPEPGAGPLGPVTAGVSGESGAGPTDSGGGSGGGGSPAIPTSTDAGGDSSGIADVGVVGDSRPSDGEVLEGR